MAVHLCDKPGESHERNFLMDAGATMGTTIGYLSAKEAGAGLAGFGLRGLGAGAVGLGVGYLAYEGVHYLSTHGYLGKTSDRTGV
jgi:hypothetical protein